MCGEVYDRRAFQQLLVRIITMCANISTQIHFSWFQKSLHGSQLMCVFCSLTHAETYPEVAHLISLGLRWVWFSLSPPFSVHVQMWFLRPRICGFPRWPRRPSEPRGSTGLQMWRCIASDGPRRARTTSNTYVCLRVSKQSWWFSKFHICDLLEWIFCRKSWAVRIQLTLCRI